MEARRRQTNVMADAVRDDVEERPDVTQGEATQEEAETRRGRTAVRRGSSERESNLPTATRRRQYGREQRVESPARAAGLRVEGEAWASRTEEEGSLIIACCDQTVKFFEVWAGKSKGNAKGRGLGTKPGVLGGSRVLEGWCEGIEQLGLAGEVESIR